jgi:hypothetical protein
LKFVGFEISTVSYSASMERWSVPLSGSRVALSGQMHRPKWSNNFVAFISRERGDRPFSVQFTD